MSERILILDANQRSALAATRSLGRQGLWVMAADTTPETLAGSSRYCRQSKTYTCPYTDPMGFFTDILNLVNENGITFLLPTTEASTYVILAFRDKLPSSVVLPFPTQSSVETLANKNDLFRLAQSLDIPVPNTRYCNNRQDGIDCLADIPRFPVVLKPFKSRILDENGITSTSVVVAHSREAYLEALERPYFASHPFTVQDFIEGEGQGIFTLYAGGQPFCFFAHRRLREKPPEGGVSVLCESREVDTRMQELSTQLLNAADWHGVAMVEFRVSPDGTPYLMEVNPRFWGSLQLAIDAGLDFPYLLYLANVHPERLPTPDYKVGRRMRWLLGDLDRLYLVMKAPLARYSLLKKFLELVSFFIPHHQTRHEVNRFSDFGPFRFELRQYLKALRRD